MAVFRVMVVFAVAQKLWSTNAAKEMAFAYCRGAFWKIQQATRPAADGLALCQPRQQKLALAARGVRRIAHARCVQCAPLYGWKFYIKFILCVKKDTTGMFAFIFFPGIFPPSKRFINNPFNFNCAWNIKKALLKQSLSLFLPSATLFQNCLLRYVLYLSTN